MILYVVLHEDINSPDINSMAGTAAVVHQDILPDILSLSLSMHMHALGTLIFAWRN